MKKKFRIEKDKLKKKSVKNQTENIDSNIVDFNKYKKN